MTKHSKNTSSEPIWSKEEDRWVGYKDSKTYRVEVFQEDNHWVVTGFPYLKFADAKEAIEFYDGFYNQAHPEVSE
jgi:hypothetical protein